MYQAWQLSLVNCAMRSSVWPQVGFGILQGHIFFLTSTLVSPVVPPSPAGWQLGLGDAGNTEMFLSNIYFTLSVVFFLINCCPDKGQPAWRGTGKGSTSRLTEGSRIPRHHPGALSCFAALFDIVKFVLFNFGSLFHLAFALLGCCSLQSYQVPLHLSYLGFLISTIRWCLTPFGSNLGVWTCSESLTPCPPAFSNLPSPLLWEETLFIGLSQCFDGHSHIWMRVKMEISQMKKEAVKSEDGGNLTDKKGALGILREGIKLDDVGSTREVFELLEVVLCWFSCSGCSSAPPERGNDPKC